MVRVRQALGVVAAPLLVAGAVALLLRGLDALPTPLLQRYPTVEALEAAAGRRLGLPAYFPESLAWPPAAAWLRRGRTPQATLVFAPREGGAPLLVLEQALAEGAALAPPPPGAVLAVRPVVLAGRAATLTERLEEGVLWRELAWTQEGRAVRMRSRGAQAELVRMAATLRPAGPP